MIQCIKESESLDPTWYFQSWITGGKFGMLFGDKLSLSVLNLACHLLLWVSETDLMCHTLMMFYHSKSWTMDFMNLNFRVEMLFCCLSSGRRPLSLPSPSDSNWALEPWNVLEWDRSNGKINVTKKTGIFCVSGSFSSEGKKILAWVGFGFRERWCLLVIVIFDSWKVYLM